MIAQAHARELPLAAGSVHCIVTSPPYFGLRRYVGLQEREWPAGEYVPITGAEPIAVPAWRGGFGSEPTVELYVWHTVLVLRECWRILRDDGTLWWNIGDSFGHGTSADRQNSESDIQVGNRGANISNRNGSAAGNLLGIPARVMLAAQAAGWTVRNDAVWAKVAPMPESVDGPHWEQKDGGMVFRRGSWRHTRAHEFVFQLTKRMGYWSDAEAVKEKQADSTVERARYGWNGRTDDGSGGSRTGSSFRRMAETGEPIATIPKDGTRNPRSVLTPSPSSYSGAHFAVFPPDLISPLILSSTPRKACPQCGAGWSPVVVKIGTWEERKKHGAGSGSLEIGHNSSHGDGMSHDLTPNNSVTGYRPSCGCGQTDHVPGIVCDPFFGSGTTGMVAREMGLRFVGLDISREYLADQALPRAMNTNTQTALAELPLFADL